MRKSRSLLLATGLVLVGVAATASVGVWGTRARQHIAKLRTENKTRSLVMESVTEDGATHLDPHVRRIKVTVKNKHDKAIVAYRFRQEDSSLIEGDISAVERDGAAVGWSLPPNAKEVTHVFVPYDDKAALILAAVLFEDGTGEGDPDDLDVLRNYSAGVKKAYERIVPMLRQAANSESADNPDAVNSLKNEIAALPVENTYEGGYARGFANGQSLIVRELGELDEKLQAGQNLQPRAGIAKILARIEEILAKL